MSWCIRSRSFTAWWNTATAACWPSSGLPDMRVPIAVALAHPERVRLDVPRLDLAAAGRLDFEEPDGERFPCLGLAYRALRGSEEAPAVLNAVNEVTVAAFLDRTHSLRCNRRYECHGLRGPSGGPRRCRRERPLSRSKGRCVARA